MDLQARPVRRRPLVSPDLVRRWAAEAGVTVHDGPLEEATVELYLYWRGQQRNTTRDVNGRRRRPARSGQGAAPPVSPALLEAASCAYRPEPCPKCGQPGTLSYVDLARAIQRHRCASCGQQWVGVIAEAIPDRGERRRSWRSRARLRAGQD